MGGDRLDNLVDRLAGAIIGLTPPCADLPYVLDENCLARRRQQDGTAEDGEQRQRLVVIGGNDEHAFPRPVADISQIGV